MTRTDCRCVDQYSIDKQKAALREYAARYGFVIVKTYAISNIHFITKLTRLLNMHLGVVCASLTTYSDAVRSGLQIRNRPGLKQLLKDVIGGGLQFKAIFVYDVSR